MKKYLLLLIVIVSVVVSICLISCESKEPYFIIKHLDNAIDTGDKIVVNVDSQVTNIDFAAIKLENNAKLDIYSDPKCTNKIVGVIVNLEVGENSYYIRVEVRRKVKIYHYLIIREGQTSMVITSVPNGMSIKGYELRMVVLYNITTFDLSDIKVVSGCEIKFYSDIEQNNNVNGMQTLQYGDNRFYTVLSVDGEDNVIYNIIVTRLMNSNIQITVSYDGAVVDGNVHTITVDNKTHVIDMSGIEVSDNATLALYKDVAMLISIEDISSVSIGDGKQTIFARVTAQDGKNHGDYIFYIVREENNCISCGGSDASVGTQSTRTIVVEQNVERYNIADVVESIGSIVRYYSDANYTMAIEGDFIVVVPGKQNVYAQVICLACEQLDSVTVFIGRKAVYNIAIADSINNTVDVSEMMASLIDSYTIAVDNDAIALLKLSTTIISEGVDIASMCDADLIIAKYQDMSMTTLVSNYMTIGLDNSDIVDDMPSTARAMLGNKNDYIMPYTLSLNTLVYNSKDGKIGINDSIAMLSDDMICNLALLGNAASAWDFITYNMWYNEYGIQSIIEHNNGTFINGAIAEKITSTQAVLSLFDKTAMSKLMPYADTALAITSGDVACAPWVSDVFDSRLLASGIRYAAVKGTVDNKASVLGEISTMILAPTRSDSLSNITNAIIEQLYNSKAYLLSLDMARIICGNYSNSDIEGNEYSEQYKALLIDSTMIVSVINNYHLVDPYTFYMLAQRKSIIADINFPLTLRKKIENAIAIMNIQDIAAITPQDYLKYQQSFGLL